MGEDILVIGGVTVKISDNTLFELDDERVSRQAFLESVTIGNSLDVEGIEGEDGTFFANEIERDSDDDDDMVVSDLDDDLGDDEDLDDDEDPDLAALDEIDGVEDVDDDIELEDLEGDEEDK